MSAEPYSDRVLALFDQPRHAGMLDDGIAVSANDQGVRLQLFAAVSKDRIQTLRFRAWGCPHVIAAAESFCADFEGRPASELAGFSSALLMQSLPVPVEKTGRILVIEDAVRSLGQLLRGTSGDTKED